MRASVPFVAIGLVGLIAGGTASVADRVAPFDWLVNESPSVPRGVYRRQVRGSAERGDVVAVSQPTVARAYLETLGAPDDMALLKRVAGGPGDRVCAEGARIEVAGRWVEARAMDRRGVRLPAWRECRRLAHGELFLLGDTASSFDSRYFGPVDQRTVLGSYERVIAW